MFDNFKLVRLTAPIFHPSAEELQAFEARGLHIQVVDAATPEDIAQHVRDADIVAVVGTKMPRLVIDSLERCRAIARMGTGTDRIDVARATERGIVVANTPYFCVEEQADHAMAMLLSLARKLPTVQRAMAGGDYVRARQASSSNQRVSHATLGLIGFGRSAVHTARRARGFGMRVLAVRGNPKASRAEADALGVTMTDLDTLLRESDYVSLHLPLDARSRHMIDDAAIARMKPTACIINTSRGAIIDEAALVRAIREGRLAGAGIDTYELLDPFVDVAPPNQHPLSGLDNVILTPHVAGGSVQAKYDMRDTAIQNCVDLLSGRWPLQENIVNPTVVPRFPLAPHDG